MIMTTMTMMTVKVHIIKIVIEGSPEGKSGTPTFVKSVVCFTLINAIFEKESKFYKLNFQKKNEQRNKHMSVLTF